MCGYCRHNRINIGRTSTSEERHGPAFCTIRNVDVPIGASSFTYCANHYVEDKTPIGPMFRSYDDDTHERIPYHGASRPRLCATLACKLCGAPSKEGAGVEVTDEKLGALQFCGSRHYVRWWKQMHPGEALMWDSDTAFPAKSGDAVFEEMQGKLKLVDVWLIIGNKGVARNLLNEVLRDGNRAQQDRARAMLSRC
jgi:FimV-like protein